MELKLPLDPRDPHRGLFESHLYGIETQPTHVITDDTAQFESHLYGIETAISSCKVHEQEV